MCDIDFDGESAEVWEDKFINRARKEHVCDMCHGLIARGESYLKHFSIFDGSITDESQCIRCCTIVNAFRREHHTWFGPSGMRDMLVECPNEDSVYGDEGEDEDEIVPLNENALRWKYAIAEMNARRDARKAVSP